jgi:hypothetical protein
MLIFTFLAICFTLALLPALRGAYWYATVGFNQFDRDKEFDFAGGAKSLRIGFQKSRYFDET